MSGALELSSRVGPDNRKGEGLMDANCIFCKIIKGEIPAEVLVDNEFALVFKDINPSAPIHYLAIPKKHIATLNDVTPQDADFVSGIMGALADAAGKLGVAESGYRVVTNVNRDGGQEVFHLHYHLLSGRRMGRMG